MLVLTRKMTERLVITVGGRDVEVQVLQINGARVTLGISAPTEVPISRPAARETDANAAGRPR